MVKVNDRVYHTYNMGLKGVVVGVEQEKANTWMVGGAASHRLVAVVKTADGTLVRIPATDLMRDD
jgi:hypothetical protein